METPVHSGGRVCTVLCYFPGAAYSSASHSHWEALPAGLAVRMKCTQALAGLEKQWLSALFANKTASLQGPLPGMRPAAQARAASGPSRALALSELQGSSIWMSSWLSWQSLSLKSCLHTAAFTEHAGTGWDLVAQTELPTSPQSSHVLSWLHN